MASVGNGDARDSYMEELSGDGPFDKDLGDPPNLMFLDQSPLNNRKGALA